MQPSTREPTLEESSQMFLILRSLQFQQQTTAEAQNLKGFAAFDAELRLPTSCENLDLTEPQNLPSFSKMEDENMIS